MTVTVTVPDSLHRKALEIAEREHVSVERVVSSALTEQLLALGRLEERAARASDDKFRAAPDKVPDTAPELFDRL